MWEAGDFTLCGEDWHWDKYLGMSLIICHAATAERLSHSRFAGQIAHVDLPDSVVPFAVTRERERG